MAFKIRVVLDTKEDVIRTLVVDEHETLENLHQVICKTFGFNGQQMASFFRTDDDWNQGEEIPLCSMSDDPDALCMATTTIVQNIEDPGEKLIYVYDFLALWTFYVELLENDTDIAESELPKLVLSIGEIPEEAPEKEFKADKQATKDPYGDFEDELNEFGDPNFGEFESLDDIDLDKY